MPDATLKRWAPLDLVAGPSGYGVPLVHASALTELDLDQMSLDNSAGGTTLKLDGALIVPRAVTQRVHPAFDQPSPRMISLDELRTGCH